MHEPLPRRNFISRVSLAITSVLALPLTSVSKSLKESIQLTEANMNPII